MNDSIEFEVGEFSEGMPWELVKNYEVSSDKDIKPCKHSLNVIRNEPGSSPTWDVGITFTVPVAVNAVNECGRNHTIMCLDCILEAAALLDGERKE